MITPKHWYFIDEQNRNNWLGQAIARGLQVKPITIYQGRIPHRFIADSPKRNSNMVHMACHNHLYTVIDIDLRKGK